MKRRIATLTIVGAMAVAAMAPATVFAAPNNNQTTVGYTAGGTWIEDGNAVVIVPKDTMFQELGGTIENFNVTSMVWDTTTDSYVNVDSTHTLAKAIKVRVSSANTWELHDTASAGQSATTLAYDYFKTEDDTQISNAQSNNEVGELSGSTGSIGGYLTMESTAAITSADYGKTFTDVLTYQFSTDSTNYTDGTWLPQ